MPGKRIAQTSFSLPGWLVALLLLYANSPVSYSIGADQSHPSNVLHQNSLFEKKTLSITLGRSVTVSIPDTSEIVTLRSTDSTVAIVRGSRVIGIKRGTSRIIATQTPSGSADTLSVSVVPWIAGASSIVVDDVETDFLGMAVRGDSVFMQSWGPTRGYKQLYQYVSNSDELHFLQEFPSNYDEEESFLSTPFGNFVLARRESATAARKVYRATRLIENPEPVASIFGPENDIVTGSYVLLQGWSYDISGNVYVGEYLSKNAALPSYQVKILKGCDFGTRWDTAYTFLPWNLTGRDGGVRHVHACQVDPYTGDIWIGTGDLDNQSRIYNHPNKLLPDSDGTVRLRLVGIGNQEYRTVSFAFTENYIYWFMDAPVNDEKIFRVRRRDSYPTLTPETLKEDDYREVVAELSDKPLYYNAIVEIGGGNVILVSSVYEDAAIYGNAYRELDTCVRVFAVREYPDSEVQTQEVFSTRSLERWGEITPIGQDLQGNIFFKTVHVEGAGVSAVYKTHLLWQDAQSRVVVPGPSQIIRFPIVGFTVKGTVVQGSFASVIYADCPPPSLDLPIGVGCVGPFYWDAQAYGLTLLDGKLSISLSKVSSVGDPASLVILQESEDGERWNNLGGEVIDNELVSTIPVTSISPVAIGIVSGGLAVQTAWIRASRSGNSEVELAWETISEVNNYGFEVQVSRDAAGPYATVPNSFVPGKGTTTELHRYSFKFRLEDEAMKWFRLKQIDLDGTIHFSEGVQPDGLDNLTSNRVPTQFSLDQNYPNPFNPSTTIKYDLPKVSYVTLNIFNTLGQEITKLVDEVKQPGTYTAVFNASTLSSGVYFYRLQAGEFVAVKKLLLQR